MKNRTMRTLLALLVVGAFVVACADDTEPAGTSGADVAAEAPGDTTSPVQTDGASGDEDVAHGAPVHATSSSEESM